VQFVTHNVKVYRTLSRQRGTNMGEMPTWDASPCWLDHFLEHPRGRSPLAAGEWAAGRALAKPISAPRRGTSVTIRGSRRVLGFVGLARDLGQFLQAQRNGELCLTGGEQTTKSPLHPA
jgi:hypothetical protein